MKKSELIGWVLFFLTLVFIGVEEVQRGHELVELRAGQEELAQGLATAGEDLKDLRIRIDELQRILGQAPVENGLASWYGDKEHGRQTASGEIFDKEALTAAHLEAPFGTYCLIVNRKNGRRTIIRINDRGPFVPGRILDLSERAARELGMIEAGVVPVRIHLIARSMPTARPGTGD